MSREGSEAPEMKKPRRGESRQGFGMTVNTDQGINVVSKNTTATAQIIPFRKAELLLVDHAGEPFVPMRPVVEGMGLDWKSQHVKITTGRFSTCVVEITMQLPGDTQRRGVTCLPLRKLTGWLMSISPNKVKPELRDGIIAYQNECDDVLWSYWNEGRAVRNDDRTIDTVLNTTIGTDGFRCLAAVVEGKARVLPASARRQAKAKLWAQVHGAFNVHSAEDIPVDQLDAARNFVAAYVLEGEWLGKPAATGSFGEIVGHALTRRERWMVSLDAQGRERYQLIPYDACVMTHRELMQAMVKPGELPVSTEEMFEFAMAAMANLKARSDYQSMRAKQQTERRVLR